MSRTIVHPHTLQPIEPVGYRKDGRLIWPILGASEDDDGDDQGDDDGQSGDADDKGDSSDSESEEEDWKAKFEAQQKINRSLERKTKRDLARLKELESKANEKDADKPDADKIREEVRAEAQAEMLRERVMDKIEAKARKFVDSEDAAAILLRSNEIDEFIDDGKIDVDAITEALDELAEKKPHLVNDAQGGKRFGGSADGGPRKKEPKRAGSLAEAVTQRYTH